MGKISNNESMNVLGIIEGIRKRPEMFIGSVSSEGLYNLVWEIVDNSVNEALAGFCDTIKVKILEENIIEVTDTGRGNPVEIFEKAGKSKIEVIFTGKYIRGELTDGIYKLSRKKYKGGLSSVNGLSEILEVTVIKDGKRWYQKYREGIPEEDVKKIGEVSGNVHGTVIRFKADRKIFEKTEYDCEMLYMKLKKIKGIKVVLSDERSSHTVKTEEIYFHGKTKKFLK